MGKQKSVYFEDEANEYVMKNIVGKESFSACLSRLLLEHKNRKK